jgi:hypothetical protein
MIDFFINFVLKEADDAQPTLYRLNHQSVFRTLCIRSDTVLFGCYADHV